MNINMGLLQWMINFLIKQISGGTVKNEIISNKELAEELHKPIIRKFKKIKVHSSFIDNRRFSKFVYYELDTWSEDLNTGSTLDTCLFGTVKMHFLLHCYVYCFSNNRYEWIKNFMWCINIKKSWFCSKALLNFFVFLCFVF